MAPGENTPTYRDMLRERGPLGTYRLVQIEADDRIMMITLNVRPPLAATASG